MRVLAAALPPHIARTSAGEELDTRGVPGRLAPEWVARLADAHYVGRLRDELVQLGRVPLLLVGEVGYILLEVDAADLFFKVISNATSGPA